MLDQENRKTISSNGSKPSRSCYIRGKMNGMRFASGGTIKEVITMFRVMLVCFSTILLSTSLAFATVDNTGMYGVYTGTLFSTAASTELTIEIGDDISHHSLSGTDLYVYVAPDTASWGGVWTSSSDWISYFGVNTGFADSVVFAQDTADWLTSGLVTFDNALSFLLTGSIHYKYGSGNIGTHFYSGTFTRATPLPGALFLLGSGLLGLAGIRHRFFGTL